VIQSAMPSAVLTTVLATEYDTEPSFVTSVVFVTTILSPLTLTPLLAIMGA
jgi:malate permease and related proteins